MTNLYIALVFMLFYKSLSIHPRLFLKMYLIRFIPTLIVWLFIGGTVVEVVEGRSFLMGILVALCILAPLLLVGFFANRKVTLQVQNKDKNVRSVISHIICFSYILLPAIVITGQAKMYKIATPYEDGLIVGSLGFIVFYLIAIVAKIVNLYEQHKNEI